MESIKELYIANEKIENNKFLYDIAISRADMDFLKKYHIENLISKLKLKVISCIYGSSNYLNNHSLDDLFNIIKAQCEASDMQDNCIYLKVKDTIIYYLKEDCNNKNVCTGLMFDSMDDLRETEVLKKIKSIDNWIFNMISETNLEQIYR